MYLGQSCATPKSGFGHLALVPALCTIHCWREEVAALGHGTLQSPVWPSWLPSLPSSGVPCLCPGSLWSSIFAGHTCTPKGVYFPICGPLEEFCKSKCGSWENVSVAVQLPLPQTKRFSNRGIKDLFMPCSCLNSKILWCVFEHHDSFFFTVLPNYKTIPINPVLIHCSQFLVKMRW